MVTHHCSTQLLLVGTMSNSILHTTNHLLAIILQALLPPAMSTQVFTQEAAELFALLRRQKEQLETFQLKEPRRELARRLAKQELPF